MNDKMAELLRLMHTNLTLSKPLLCKKIIDFSVKNSDHLSHPEKDLVSSVLMNLIRLAPLIQKKQIAVTVQSTSIYIPDIINLLAQDDPDVAQPFLTRPEYLSNKNLTNIIRTRTEKHRIAIAGRNTLSPQIITALIEYGDTDTLETLLQNKNIKIEKPDLEYLVAESRRIERFRLPLIQRSDMPADLAYKMFSWVPSELRKKIITSYTIDRQSLEQVAKNITRTPPLINAKNKDPYTLAQKHARQIQEKNELTIPFLINTLRQKRFILFSAGLAELGKVNFKTVWQIFNDKGGESFALLAKAIGFDRNQFTTTYLLIIQAKEDQTPKAIPILNQITALFDTVDENSAKAAILIWQREGGREIALEVLGT